MTIEEKLKDCIIEKYGNMTTFAEKIDMPLATLSTIMKRGIDKATISNILKICKELNISADSLAHNRIMPIKEPKQDHVFIPEVSKMIHYMRNNLSEYDDMTLYGEPMTESEIEMLVDGIELTAELIKRQRRRSLK